MCDTGQHKDEEKKGMNDGDSKLMNGIIIVWTLAL